MVKSAYQSMRAAQEFLKEQNIAQLEGWIVAGASKRGWTTWLAGATKCESCPINILGIVPLVPIVPDLIKEIHR
jgi:PhoPQ-activated pathogenicity-related protein